jgi:OOP family OmpA-OmpF porin
MLKRQLLFFFYFFVFCASLTAQNLIPDSSFENYINKPINLSAINQSKNWYAPTKGTTDYFSANKDESLKQANVPSNDFGYQKALSGNCYAGFIVYSPGRNYREYLQTKLTSTLVKGKTYCLTFNFSLADNSMWQIDKLGVILSENEIRSNKMTAIENEHVIYFPMDSISKFDTLNWIPACYYFMATQNEAYLTIGGFEVDKPIFRKIKYNPKIKNKPKNFSYYYIDEVSLHQISDSTLCSCNVIGRQITKPPKQDTLVNIKSQLTTTIILKNILFDVNEYSLLPSSYKELDSLVVFLKENRTKYFEVAGHTDSTGKENNNVKLSKERAKAVAVYLIKKGVDENRITYNGYGSKMPLKPNNTEENKQANRRVEIIFK